MLCLLPLHAEGRQAHDNLADSVLNCVRSLVPLHRKEVGGYEAQLYVKNLIDVKRRNFLLRFLPNSSSLRKGSTFIMETNGDHHFTAPDIYERKIKASMGTIKRLWKGDGRIEEYFHLQIYAPTLIDDKLLSPLSGNSHRYYRFTVDSVSGEAPRRYFRLNFTPRYSSYQLVKGHMWVSEQNWTVRRLVIDVRSEYFKCHVDMQMGAEGAADELLPVQVELDGKFRFLGNRVDGKYLALFTYDKVFAADSSYTTHKSGKNRYDLSSSYTLTTDTNAYQSDTATFARLRPLPLTPSEQEIYTRHAATRKVAPDTTEQARRRETWSRVGSFLVEPNTVNLRHFGSVRIPPLINPLMWGYSPKNGISYSQRLRYRGLFKGDKQLTVTPFIGYNFKHKEFYWKVNTDFEYSPRKRRGVNVEVGNGNRLYNSSMLDVLEEMPDSMFNPDELKMSYYRDLYLKLQHRWEIVNGLSLDVNLALHRRTGKHNSLPIGENNIQQIEWIDEYNSFAPGLRLSWTPGQYYYMSGNRKVNLHSRYPTFSVDWEHGIPDVLPHSGRYDRVEVDMQHYMPVGPMCVFYYRLGYGMFSKQRDTYFVDFNNFRRSNLPIGWGDDIGGVFQLLDGRWYNSSRRYARANITLEAPFLIMPYLGAGSRFVLNERLYLGILSVPNLRPYFEVGYGMGTHIFDIGVFTSFANWKYKEAGVKFTLELFSK